jgi:hypothetical protein
MEDQGEKWGLLFIFPHWVQWPVELKVCSRSDMQFCTFPSSMAPAGQQCREMERTKQGSPHMQQEMLKVLMEPWSTAMLGPLLAQHIWGHLCPIPSWKAGENGWEIRNVHLPLGNPRAEGRLCSDVNLEEHI